MLIDPKDITLTDTKGVDHHYRISRIPYLDGGREVCSQFETTAQAVTGNYAENEKLAEKMFKYVAVIMEDGRELQLTTRQMINNHIPDFTTGILLEEEMVSHNLGFSLAGKVQKSHQDLSASIKQWITSILTPSPDASPAPDSAPCTNSEPSTPSKTRS